MDDFENFRNNFNQRPEPSIELQQNYDFIDDLLSEAHLGLPIQTPEPFNIPEFEPVPTIEPPADTHTYAPQPAGRPEHPAADLFQPAPSRLQATTNVQNQGILRPLYIRPGAVVARATIRSSITPVPHPSKSQAQNCKTLQKYRLKKDNELPQALVSMSEFMRPTQGTYGQ